MNPRTGEDSTCRVQCVPLSDEKQTATSSLSGELPPVTTKPALSANEMQSPPSLSQ